MKKKRIVASLIILIVLTLNLMFPIISNAADGELVTITFQDEKLYNGILVDLGNKIASHDDSSYTIQMTQANINSVTGIIIWNRGITNLSGIEIFKNLDTLQLQNNQISDITPLQGFTKLKHLTLYGNQISDITPLKGLTNLTYLSLGYDVYGNKISNISALEGLTNLTALHLPANEISDITPLKNLTKLEELDLHSNQISNISALEGLTNLTYLSLRHNEISDVTPLKGFTNLTYLNLWNNQISDITVLGGLTNLTQLYLMSNQISDVTPLEGLTNLQRLDLSGNQISDITPLKKLTNLTILDLMRNQIRDAEILDTILTNVNISISSQSIEITTNKKEVELPKIFLQAKDINSRMYTKENFVLKNCTLNSDGTKVILDENATQAKVEIVKGPLDESILTINGEDNNPPQLEVLYSTKELINGTVVVTIKANEKIQQVDGWKLGEDGKTLTKEFTKNTTEEIIVYDLAGNATTEKIEVNNILTEDGTDEEVDDVLPGDGTDGEVEDVLPGNGTEDKPEIDNTSKEDGSTAPVPIPQTGKTPLVSISIIVMIGIVFILYKKTREFKDIK